MKNNLGKRMFSILLSALMAITMIPSFAFNAYAEDANLTALNNAISAYETKMNGTLYTNMSAAYTAYVNANKARDAYVYGGANIDLATVASSLTTATNNMSAWSAHSGSVPVYLCTEAVDYYSNVLYATAQGKDNQSFSSGYVEIGDTSWGAQRKTYYKAAAPSTLVMYYNGNLNDLYFPVAFECYARNDKNRTVQYVDLNGDSNLELKGYWRGYQQGWDDTYGIVFTKASTSTGNNCSNGDGGYNSSLGVVEIGYSSSNTKDHKLSKDGDSKKRFFVNKAYVKALNNNTLSKTGGITMRMKTDYGTGTNSNSSKIYVVNYYQLTQAVNDNKNKLNNVTNYKQGGLSSVISEFDKVTSFNISQYKSGATQASGYTDGTVTAISESNAGDYYNYVQNFCSYHASELASVTAGNSDNDYSALRNAINYEGKIANLGDDVNHSVRDMAAVQNGEELYTNFAAFNTAYNNARTHMAELYGGSYATDSTPSTLATALINAFNNLGIKGAAEPSISGDSTFISNSETVTITNNDTSGATVHYTVAYDGEETPSVSETFSGTSATISVFGGNNDHGTAIVTAWATQGSSASSSVFKSFINEDYEADSLVYHESFDGASISDLSFISGSEKGVNGTLANSGTAHIEGSAGADYDKRTNVLKIDASTLNTRGNYIQMARNPLSDSVNAAYAKTNGVTISFWRKHNAENSGRWLNSVSFTSYDSSHTANRYKYLTLTSSAAFTFVQRDENGQNGGYVDYFPNDCDITNHSASAAEGYWANIVLTVNPKKDNLNDAIIMYINGEPHDVSSTDVTAIVSRAKGANYADTTQYSDSDIIEALLDFITDKNTHFDFAYSGYGDVDIDKDLWLDDIRIYSKSLTQVDINNMYTDSLTDAKNAGVDYQSSTSHDPTNVTVYTLKNAVTTDNGTKPAGSKVGQEFIDYYHVSASDCDVEYYSFGTGLTVYHSYDNLNWTCVGDSQGRFGYQNQELFVSATGQAQPYYTTLADTLAWAAQDTTSDTRAGAAGKLVWAPHVCYNLTTDKWMYYGSTSSWDSKYSTVFLLTSDYIDHGYKYIETIVKSQTGDDVNCIDACVYYGHNTDGSINKNELYCLFGSWYTYVRVKTLNADGTRSDEETDQGTILSIQHGGGEGGYMTYIDGYYYYFITCEANGWAQGGGNYHERVFRSTNPTSGFVSVAGTDASTEADPHGNAFLTAHTNAATNYKYTSTGHSSIYKAYNGYNEEVYINAAHTREYSKDSKPVEDGALATRQISLIGNVAIQNPVAVTSDGWLTAFPKLYDNTFSLHNKTATGSERNYFTAYDIDGEYSANTMSENGIVAEETEFKFYALNSKMGIMVDASTLESHLFFVDYDNNEEITYLHINEDDGTHYAEGVVANQGTNGSATVMFSYLIENGSNIGHNVWGVRTKDNTTIDDIQDSIDNVSTAINGIGYYAGSPAVNTGNVKAYNNVAYTSSTTSWSAKANKGYLDNYLGMPLNTVLVYDGVEKSAYFPVAFLTVAENTDRKPQMRRLDYNKNDFHLYDNWVGYTSEESVWPGSFTAIDSIGVNSDSACGQHTSSDKRYWGNKLYYTGSLGSSEYYKTYTDAQFKMYTRYKVAVINTNSDEDGTIDPVSGTTIYVVNYKPVLDILNGNTKFPGTNLVFNQQLYNDIKANKYTATSTMAFYRAMELLVDVNPSSEKYNYSSNVSAAVQACANDIKHAVDVFNSVNLERRADLTKFDNAFERADSFLKSQDGKVSQYSETSVVALKNALTAGNVSTYVSADAETRADYGASEQTDADNLADAIDAAYEGLTLATVDSSAFVAAVTTVTNLDPEAYDHTSSIDSALSTAATVSTDTVEYGGATITFVTENDQDNVDAATDVIMANLTASVKQYDVNASEADVKEIGANNGQYYTNTNKATYGTKLTFRSDDVHTAWFLELTTATTTKHLAFAGSGAKFETRVLGNVRVKAVSKTDELNCRVTIVRNYDNDPDKAPVEYLNYVESGTEFELPSAPALAFYDFIGYYIGDTKINTASVNITEDVDIVARYEANSDATYAINATDINNTAQNSTAAYNNKVELKGGSGTYAWIEAVDETHYRPFSIGENVSFFATESVTLKAVSEEAFNAYNFAVPTVNLRKSGTITSGTVESGIRTIFNGQVVTDNIDNIRECGILIGVANGVTPDASNLILENTGTQTGYKVVRAKSTKFVGANQFSIAIKGLPDGVVYRAYVIFDRGEGTAPETVYTDVM